MRSKVIASTAILGLMLFSGCTMMNQQEHTDCLVQSKDIVLDGNEDGGIKKTKRVSTTCGSFDVEDNLAGGFDSWDLWAKLEVGKSYDIKAGGYRIGFFSQFPHVLEVTPHER